MIGGHRKPTGQNPKLGKETRRTLYGGQRRNFHLQILCTESEWVEFANRAQAEEKAMSELGHEMLVKYLKEV